MYRAYSGEGISPLKSTPLKLEELTDTPPEMSSPPTYQKYNNERRKSSIISDITSDWNIESDNLEEKWNSPLRLPVISTLKNKSMKQITNYSN